MNPAYLEHPITKQIKEAPVGNWNWLVFFLGPIAPLLRGDFKETFYFCVPLIGCPYRQLVGVIKYNFWYIKDLLKKGYKIKSLPPTMTPEMLSTKIGMNARDYMAEK